MSHRPLDTKVYDLIGVGFGPSNLSLAICLEEIAKDHGSELDSLFIEKQQNYSWHGNTLVDQSALQISFLKDLVSLRNPTSPYSFVNYLHSHGRLVEFINMNSFYPSRVEFDDYLRWVARHFSRQAVYGEEVLRIEPVYNGQQVDRLRVVCRSQSGEERARVTRSVVIASGGKPRIPTTFQELQSDSRIFHHAHYLTSISRLPCSQGLPMHIAVVGGGQSAVEAFVDLSDNFPSVKVDLILRTSALKPADSSPFVNEIFAPEYVDRIFREPPELRQQLIDEYQSTNYAVADLDLIERIYSILYRQKVVGQVRHSVLARTQIDHASTSPEGVTLTLRDLAANQVSARSYDAVILATGYERQSHHKLLAPLQELLGDIQTNRHYRVEADADLITPIYLQGFSEASHGLSETLLSVLAIRSEEIGRSLHDALSVGPEAIRGESKRPRARNRSTKESDVQTSSRLADAK